MELRAGNKVDRYVLVEPLGQGGQGAVWKVVDPLENAVRTLKLFFLRNLDARAADRARREARAVAGATHPALLPCRGLYEDPAAQLIGLIFDYVPGRALDDASRDPRMSPEHRRAALAQIATALAHVHGLGVVHRDLKPQNVLVTDAFWATPHAPGGVKLLDFGIAAPAGNPQPITLSGVVIGTVAYLAPELLAAGRWTAPPEGFQRDVFAFGVLGFELLCGAHPAGLATDASLAAFLDVYMAADAGRRPWPPTGPDGTWGAVIRACLALDPQRRPIDGAAVAAMIGPSAAVAPAAGALAPGSTDPHRVPTDSQVSLPPTAVSVPVPIPRVSVPEVPRTTPMPAPPSEALRPSQPGSGPASGEGRRSAATPLPGPSSGTLRSGIPRGERGGSAPDRASAPSSQRSGGGTRTLAIGIMLGAALTITAGLVALERSNEVAPAELVTTWTATPSATPLRPEPRETPAPTMLVPCCKERTKCVSPERVCRPEPCNDGILPGERTWWLRPIGAAKRPDTDQLYRDLAGTNPDARVCMTRKATGDSVCSSLVRIAKAGGDRRNRLAITTRDIVDGSIEIRIDDGSTTLVSGSSTPIPEGVLTSALCKGLLLYVGPGPKSRALAYLSTDLDPR